MQITDYMVSGRFRNKENVQDLIAKIRAKGKSCYDFTAKPADPSNPDKSGEEQMQVLESHPDFLNDPIHKDHFETDYEGLKNAAVLVLLLPAGTSAHMEAGIAHGMGKKLILVGKPEKPETLYFVFDEYYDTVDEFVASIE